MVELEISLLGSPSIRIGGRPFDTDRRKAIALLAYLIVAGKPQPREQLAAFLWPDYDRESAFAYLRRTLYELNQGLGEKRLLADRHTAGIDTSADALVDTVVFERELAAARSAQDPAPHLEAALTQYKGEFLAGFFVQDAEPFEDWLRQQQEGYRRDYAAALERLVDVYEIRGSWEPALEHALAWVALDDLNEVAHRAAMRVYAGRGERSRAIRQYEICAQALRDELGVEPLPETTALFERIREGGVAAVWQAEPQSPGGKGVSNLHLPILTTPFIGRRAEIEQVKELILHPDNRLVTLFGLGGIGKTRLSIQAASEVGEHFLDGVWFVPLATVQTPEGIAPAVAKALNFSFRREDENPRQQLLDYLHKRQLLFVLDNLDQLVAPETIALLLEILTSAEAVKLLVTSRVRLAMRVEQVFPVPGMSAPTPQEAALWRDPETQARDYSAIQLFLDRARRIQPGFGLDQANAAAVAEICQMVGGLPLGLELAASWLELLPPDEIAVEIRRSLDFLETDQADVPDRQRSIRAIFDTSWRLLNEEERQAFLALSVFAGSLTREAAQTVSGAALRTLLSLANKAWLQQVEGGRFQLQALLQHYGLEQLRRNETAWRRVHDQHAAYYAGFVGAQSERMRGAEQLAALQGLSEEFDTNIKAAWDWLVAEGSWAEIREKMVMGLFQFGLIRWRGAELIEWLRRARLKLEPVTSREARLTLAILGAVEIYFEENWGIKEYRPEERLVALWQLVEQHQLAESMGFWFVLLGKIYATRNHAPLAEDQVEAAILRIRRQGEPSLLGFALMTQSYLFGQFPATSLVEKTNQNLQEALGIFRTLGTIYEQGEILRSMAEIAVFKKLPFEEVADLAQQAQQFSFRLNDRFGFGMGYYFLGMVCFMRGRVAEGFQAFHEMRSAFEQLGDQRMVGDSLSWESIWAARYSTFEHALETRQSSIEYSQKYTSQTVYFWNIFELGEIYRIFGNQKKASEYYEAARLDFERVNLVLGLGYYQRALGDIAMQEGRYAEALQHYLAYQAYAEQDNHMWSMAQASARQAWAYTHLGEIEPSRSSIYRCLNLLQNADEVDMELGALLAEAHCLAEEGKYDSATALAAFVAGHPMLWKETHDLAQELLVNLAKNLDAESFQAACSRLEVREVRELTAAWLVDYQRLS